MLISKFELVMDSKFSSAGTVANLALYLLPELRASALGHGDRGGQRLSAGVPKVMEQFRASWPAARGIPVAA